MKSTAQLRQRSSALEEGFMKATKKTRQRGVSAVMAVVVIGIIVLLTAAGIFAYTNFIAPHEQGGLSKVVLDLPKPPSEINAAIPTTAVSNIGFTLSVPQ